VALGDICDFVRHSKHLNNEINIIIVIYDIPSKNTNGTNDFFLFKLVFLPASIKMTCSGPETPKVRTGCFFSRHTIQISSFELFQLWFLLVAVNSGFR